MRDSPCLLIPTITRTARLFFLLLLSNVFLVVLIDGTNMFLNLGVTLQERHLFGDCFVVRGDVDVFVENPKLQTP